MSLDRSGRRFRLPGIAGVCAALVPPEAGGPNPKELARRVEAYAAVLPAVSRYGLRALVATANGVGALSGGRTLGELDVRAREAALARLANSPARHAFAALKALVLMVAGTDRFAGDLIARAQLKPPVRPDSSMSVTRASSWPSRSTCDVVVVGSGAGGAFAARTLARAGLDVVVIEEGRQFAVEEFRTRHALHRFTDLYRDAGATAALGFPPVLLPIGRAVGGTTVGNSGTCFRPPEGVLQRWRDGAGLKLADPDALRSHLEEVEATLEVAPVPLEVMGNNGLIVMRGAEALGWRTAPLRRNAPGCDGCSQCSIGCPLNAKFGVHLNALPQACAAGARIVSEARVVRVLHEGGRARGVLARRPDESEFVVRAPRVVVAAGATETPPLLRRSGLGRHPEMGRNLAIHPSVGVLGRFEEPVVAWKGVMQSASVEEFHSSDGILLEATSTPPGMGAMSLPGFGRQLVARLADAEYLASVGAMVADAPSGRVLGARRAVIVYNLSRRDGARLIKAMGIIGRVLLAAGAKEILLGIPGHAAARSEAELDEALSAARPKTLHLAAFHPTGTARAGADASRYPVDEEGRLRGVDGVWVADGSILPTCPRVNPQVSIMALSLAVAGGIAS
ncbi:MAG: GMC family oxidoreductase [Actinomycetota bacterium]